MGITDLGDKLRGKEADKKLVVLQVAISQEGKLGYPGLKTVGYKAVVTEPVFPNDSMTVVLAQKKGKTETALLLVGDAVSRGNTVLAIEENLKPGDRTASKIKDLLADQPTIKTIDVVVLNPRTDAKTEMQPDLVMKGDTRTCVITVFENKQDAVEGTPLNRVLDNERRVPGGVVMLATNRTDAIKIGSIGNKPAITVVRDVL